MQIVWLESYNQLFLFHFLVSLVTILLTQDGDYRWSQSISVLGGGYFLRVLDSNANF